MVDGAKVLRHALATLSASVLNVDPGPTWAAAFDAARWCLGGAQPSVPRGVSEGDHVARSLMLRTALLVGNHELTATLCENPASSEGRLLSLWAKVWRGGSCSREDVEHIASEARSQGNGGLVVEAVALEALVMLEAGFVAEGLRKARHAARMGRTEELPFPAFLANCVLARARRLSGGPMQGAHILRSIRRVAPTPWHRWIDWEEALCRGTNQDVGSWLALRTPSWFALGDRDLSFVEAAAGRRPVSDASLAAWATGDSDHIPFGLTAFASVDGITAVAVGTPGQPPRRVLGACQDQLQRAGATPIDTGARRTGRASRLLACLCLAEHGIDTPTLFRQAYGTVFVEDLHRGVLDVQLHRCRKALPDGVEIVRESGRLHLRYAIPISVADPRGDRPGDERVLGLFGQHGRLNAKDTARHLNISRRAAATVLKELADEGFCRARVRKRGELVYTVEDSVFHTPTETGALREVE